LTSKTLNLAVWEWNETVSLEEIKDALAKEVHNNADMTPIIKAIPQMNAAIPVLFVISLEGGENSQFYPRCITIFLHGSNNFDSDLLVASAVISLDNFSESALTK
jgi:hypothetical protein